MKRVSVLILALSFLQGGIFDVFKIKDAQEAFKSGDFNKSIQEYSQVKDKSDEVKYNLGEAYYKAGNYKKALEEFNSIKSKKLEFKKLHNLGNTLAHLGKIDEAIKAYKKALKIKEDKDTRFNLELLEKLKKKKNKKQQNKNKNQQKKNQNKQNKKSKQNQNSKNSSSNQNKSNQEPKENKQNQKSANKKEQKKQENKQNSKKQKSSQEKKQEQKDKQSQAKKDKQKQQIKQGQIKKLPISDMELRKYNKLLDKRGIKTLMLPLPSKGVKKDEKNINPW